MSNLTRILLLGGWCLSLWGVLQLGNIELPSKYEHAICGAWGCGPRIMDLIAYQSFQVVLLTGPAWLAARLLKTPWPRRIAVALVTCGIALLVGMLIHELVMNWSTHREHFWQRYLFRVAISVDIPALALLLAGGVALFFIRPMKVANDAASTLDPAP